MNPLYGSIIPGYLNNQQERMLYFQEQNSVPLSLVAAKYAPFNDPSLKNIVGCSGSYPVYNEPSISQSNLGYISYMNNVLRPFATIQNQQKINQMTSEKCSTVPPLSGTDENLNRFVQGQRARKATFNQMIWDQNPTCAGYNPK